MIFKKFFNKDARLSGYFSDKFNIHPRVMDLILSRDITTEEEIAEFINPTKLLDPFLIRNMKELCDRVKLAKEMKDNVLIFGDYDVDGVSATAIMLNVLKILGINANYYLPNRYIDGYGLTNSVIDKIAKKYNPNLIITVDCGIACYKEIEYAKEKGIEVIVTDHHEIPDILPDCIVLNAKIRDQEYPFRELCGTGLAYKIAEALLGEKKAEEFLPIAAIATIADIVPILSENRTIVKKGLKLFDKYLPYGIKELLKENKIPIHNPLSSDISFKVAPKLNASGRMGDASDSLNLYLETDPVKVKKYLAKIKNHNTKRQELCNKVMEDCLKALKKQDMNKIRVICLASKSWDQGILGIVCSRLVEEYNRPVFLFSQEGDLLRGSGRSINDINIHELLSSLSDILETYGGHTMAAGLTLKRNQYEEFSKRVNAFAFEKVNDKVFMPIKYYDQEITAEEIDERFIKDLTLLEPVGCGNAKPKFKITVNDIELEPMKYCPQHATINIGDLQLLYFNFSDNFTMLNFARQKSFIFELQNNVKKGIVSEFDGGTYIVENTNTFSSPLEYQQLCYENNGECKFKYYPNSELLNLVTISAGSIFGTAFVTFSGYDFVNFSKTYTQQNIFNISINQTDEIGYNSLLLSPKGVDWAKNFSRIIFLGPVLDFGYIKKINEVSSAEIFIPMDKTFDQRRLVNLDLSRETFGKIFTALSTKQQKASYDIFDLYQNRIRSKNIKFDTFYCAIKVFEELKILTIEKDIILSLKLKKDIKKSLDSSVLYKKLVNLKESLGRENV